MRLKLSYCLRHHYSLCIYLRHSNNSEATISELRESREKIFPRYLKQLVDLEQLTVCTLSQKYSSEIYNKFYSNFRDSRFSSNSEANALELLENLEEMSTVICLTCSHIQQHTECYPARKGFNILYFLLYMYSSVYKLWGVFTMMVSGLKLPSSSEQ